MGRLIAVFLVLALVFGMSSPAHASNDQFTTSGYYNAVPDGGLGVGFTFHASFVMDRVNVGGVVYLGESDGDGGHRYRKGNDWFTFDVVLNRWTYYDEGFATFGGTYTGPM